MKKVFLYCLLLICFVNTINAQQALNSVFFSPELKFANTAQMVPMGNFNLMADGATADPNYYPTGYDKFGTFGKVALGFGNLFFGLGSFIAGEPLDGLMLLLNYGISGGLVAGGLLLTGVLNPSGSDIGMFVAGGWILPFVGGIMAVAGGYMFVRTLVDAFLYPFRLGSPPSSNKSIDRPYQNVNVAFIPLPNGNIAGQLSYNIRF
jgi:hypothetical protein